MSFVRRSQLDSDYTDGDIQFLAASALLPDARLAERRVFDWYSLSRFLNATPEELYEMSERSFFYKLGDDRRRGFFRQRAPWVQEGGYSAHCPCCLKESQHWRKAWLGPGALVCASHNTVMVRHCHGCGGDLAQMAWGHAAPICPTCCAHLSLSPVIPAPPAISRSAATIQKRYASLVARKPVDLFDYDLAHFSAMWRAARLFRCADKGLRPLFEAVRSLACLDVEIGSSDSERDDGNFVQTVIAADLIGQMEPTFSEHFWLSATNAAIILGVDRIVYFKLIEIAHEFGISVSLRSPVVGQLTMSFASWYESKGIPRAA